MTYQLLSSSNSPRYTLLLEEFNCVSKIKCIPKELQSAKRIKAEIETMCSRCNIVAVDTNAVYSRMLALEQKWKACVNIKERVSSVTFSFEEFSCFYNNLNEFAERAAKSCDLSVLDSFCFETAELTLNVKNNRLRNVQQLKLSHGLWNLFLDSVDASIARLSSDIDSFNDPNEMKLKAVQGPLVKEFLGAIKFAFFLFEHETCHYSRTAATDRRVFLYIDRYKYELILMFYLLLVDSNGCWPLLTEIRDNMICVPEVPHWQSRLELDEDIGNHYRIHQWKCSAAFGTHKGLETHMIRLRNRFPGGVNFDTFGKELELMWSLSFFMRQHRNMFEPNYDSMETAFEYKKQRDCPELFKRLFLKHTEQCI